MWSGASEIQKQKKTNSYMYVFYFADFPLNLAVPLRPAGWEGPAFPPARRILIDLLSPRPLPEAE